MGALVLLLLACRPTDPTRSVSEPTDPTLTTPTSPIDSAPTSVTGLPATTAQTGTTAETAPTGTTGTATSGTSITGSTADTCPTAATAHTGNPHTDAPFTADTAADCPADPFTVAVGLGDTATACGDLPDDIPAPCVRQRRVEQTELSCVSTTGDTSATPACPTFDWALHARSPYTQNVVAMDTLPDGDILIVGQYQLTFTVAEGRPDETTITQACGVRNNGYVLRLRPDGTVVWGYPLVDSCLNAWVQGMRITPQGNILVWGEHMGDELTLRYGHPQALSLPATPTDAFGGHESEYWWALLDPGGAPIQLHSVSAPGDHGRIIDMDASPSGTVVAVGLDFDGVLTLDARGPSPVTLADDPDDDQPIWIAAWNADGTPRWAKLEMRGPELFGNTSAAVRALDDSVVVHVQVNSPAIFGRCENQQTVVNGTGELPTGLLRLGPEDGALQEPVRLRILPAVQALARDGDRWLAAGRVQQGYHPTVLHGHALEDNQGAIFRLRDDGSPTGPHAASVDTNGTSIESVAVADDGWILTGGPTTTTAGAPLQWQCGPVVASGDGGQSRVTWHLFTPDLEPTCGGTLGISDDYMFGTATVAFDNDQGFVVASSLSEPLTIERGTPYEQTFDPILSDLLVVRYAR